MKHTNKTQSIQGKLMAFPSRREGFFLIVVACAAAMSFAYYAQYVMGLEPCPLCMFQRAGVVAVGLIALLATSVGSSTLGFHISSALITSVALVGSSLSIRHLWLQSLAVDQAVICGPGLEYMLQTLPFTSVLSKVLQGSGECAVVAWSLLGIALPGWVLLFFVIVIVFTMWQWKRHG